MYQFMTEGYFCSGKNWPGAEEARCTVISYEKKMSPVNHLLLFSRSHNNNVLYAHGILIHHHLLLLCYRNHISSPINL